MRIEPLLVHRATLLIPGREIGTDPYGRPIYSEPSTESIKCRLDQYRERTSVDAEGTDVLLSYILYTGPENDVDTDMQITNVIDEKGNVVVDGTFNIEQIYPAYTRSRLHHYELNLSSGDQNYG